jgi:hypothetical protein
MEVRVSRLEDDMRDTKAAIARREATTIRIETMLTSTLPRLVTKADLAEKPRTTDMWGILAVFLIAYGYDLVGFAVLK